MERELKLTMTFDLLCSGVVKPWLCDGEGFYAERW